MDEQEQSSAQAQTETAGEATAAPVFHAEEVVHAVTDPTPVDPAPAIDQPYPDPAPSGAIHAAIDEIHAAVEYANDEVKHTVRSIVRRLRDML